MCYAKPGPRCSSHTKEYVKKCEKLLKQSEKTGNSELIAKANNVLALALYEYYTSPEGLRKLKKSVETAERQGDTDKASALSNLHARASADRDGRMAAYQRMVAATERPPQQSLSSKVKSLLGMSEPEVPSAQLQSLKKGVTEKKVPTWVKEDIPGVVSYRRSDAPPSDADADGLMSEWRREVIAEQSLEEVEVAAMMDRTIPITTEAESRYYYNPELRNSRPSLEEWTPRTESERYAMTQVVGAVVSQRQAAFENAGLSKSAMDTVVERRGIDGEADSIRAVSFGANPDEESGVIGNYDEGWLYSFHRGVEDVKTFQFTDGDESVQKAELRRFVTAQKESWQAKHDAVDNDFNGGGLDAWDNWYDDM